MGETVTPDRPAVAGVLPRSGERFQGLLPPLAERPVFTIRKRASIVFTLEDYVTKGILSAAGADVTGHPGGVATIHANSAADALRRIEDLVGEASQVIPNRSIASAINLVIFIERVSGTAGRTVRSIVEVHGFDGGDYVFRDAKAED
jgi:Flp pilus assembly CpaF family ATPase